MGSSSEVRSNKACGTCDEDRHQVREPTTSGLLEDAGSTRRRDRTRGRNVIELLRHVEGGPRRGETRRVACVDLVGSVHAGHTRRNSWRRIVVADADEYAVGREDTIAAVRSVRQVGEHEAAFTARHALQLKPATAGFGVDRVGGSAEDLDVINNALAATENDPEAGHCEGRGDGERHEWSREVLGGRDLAEIEIGDRVHDDAVAKLEVDHGPASSRLDWVVVSAERPTAVEHEADRLNRRGRTGREVERRYVLEHRCKDAG